MRLESGSEDLQTFESRLTEPDGGQGETAGLKRSYSSPSLIPESSPVVVKVKRNISERRTYRRIIPKRNKNLVWEETSVTWQDWAIFHGTSWVQCNWDHRVPYFLLLFLNLGETTRGLYGWSLLISKGFKIPLINEQNPMGFWSYTHRFKIRNSVPWLLRKYGV